MLRAELIVLQSCIHFAIELLYNGLRRARRRTKPIPDTRLVAGEAFSEARKLVRAPQWSLPIRAQSPL
jgi:hypothetical protein